MGFLLRHDPRGSSWPSKGRAPLGLGLCPDGSLDSLSVWFSETCDCEGYLKGHYVGK